MRRLQRITTTLIVWATTASLLLAATPFFVCQCPNGQIKAFCFAQPSACDQDTCCPSAEGVKTCCGRKLTSDPGPSTTRAHSGPSFEKSTCQKTLVQAQSSPLNRAETKPASSSFEILNSPFETGSFVPVPTSVFAFSNLTNYRFPPTTDLITSLHRLTV